MNFLVIESSGFDVTFGIYLLSNFYAMIDC